MNAPMPCRAGHEAGCLYGSRFDNGLVFGTLALALVSAALASLSPAMFMAVVLMDIWFFANPHVIATYTRIGANRLMVRRHWFLISLLPVIVLLSVMATALAYEVEGLFTVYFIAQTFHVARQSFGIARAYRRVGHRQVDPPLRPDRLSEVLIYLLPLWGLMHRCAEGSHLFLGYAIQLPAVAPALANLVGAVAMAGTVWWLFRSWRVVLGVSDNPRHDWFVASHLFIFAVAYLWVSDMNLGWLMVNIWHNLQYLLFVWLRNVRRDQAVQIFGAASAVLANEVNSSPVCPWKHAAKYLALCLVGGAALYEALNLFGEQWLWLGYRLCSSPISP